MVNYKINVKFKNGTTDSVIVNGVINKNRHIRFLKSKQMKKLVDQIKTIKAKGGNK